MSRLVARDLPQLEVVAARAARRRAAPAPHAAAHGELDLAPAELVARPPLGAALEERTEALERRAGCIVAAIHADDAVVRQIGHAERRQLVAREIDSALVLIVFMAHLRARREGRGHPIMSRGGHQW